MKEMSSLFKNVKVMNNKDVFELKETKETQNQMPRGVLEQKGDTEENMEDSKGSPLPGPQRCADDVHVLPLLA